MASYETGTFTSAGASGDSTSLINKLVTFLTGNGWTNDSTILTQGSGKRVHLSKSDLFINLRGYENETRYKAGTTETGSADATLSPTGANISNFYGLAMNAGTATYQSGNSWETQTNAPVSGASANPASRRLSVEMRGVGVTLAGTYHFIVQSSPVDSVWVFIEQGTGSGNFQFLGFGDMVKSGSFTGGQFITGSVRSGTTDSNVSTGGYQKQAFSTYTFAGYQNTFIRVASIDGFTGWLGYDGGTTAGQTTSEGSTGKGLVCCIGDRASSTSSPQYQVPSYFPFYSSSVNKYGEVYAAKSQVSSQATFLPLFAYCHRSDNFYSLIGRAPNAYYCRTDNYAAAQVVTIGAASYRVFPFKNKNPGISNYDHDGDGIALKV